ncbi:MAG: hypothetical protein FVQ79_02200 [Planctomycetes bacterium]|nr:hypothetical protein [Planctomycetota bacterium]
MTTIVLGQLIYKVGVEMGVVLEGIVTGGGTTTIVDLLATGTKEFASKKDDYWNGGTAGVIWDATGAGAAPQWEFSEINDYGKTLAKLTLASALSAAVVAGDIYYVMKRNTPARMVIQKINSYLSGIPVETTDITTITTASGQREYTLPGAASLDLRSVGIQENTGDSDDNRWNYGYAWEIQKTATGSADKLVFLQQPPDGRAVELKYIAAHSPLYVYSDKLNESVHPDLVVLETCQLIIQASMRKDQTRELQGDMAIFSERITKINEENPIITTPAQVQLNTRFSSRRTRSRWPGDKSVL